MRILPHQNYQIKTKEHPLPPKIYPSKVKQQAKIVTQPANGTQQQKKNLQYQSNKHSSFDYSVQGAKENIRCHKVFKQLQQLDTLNLNNQLLLTPFSQINNKIKSFDSHNKPNQAKASQNCESQIGRNPKQTFQRRRQKAHQCNKESKNMIEKILQEKLSHMPEHRVKYELKNRLQNRLEERLENELEKKRKSISHRVPSNVPSSVPSSSAFKQRQKLSKQTCQDYQQQAIKYSPGNVDQNRENNAVQSCQQQLTFEKINRQKSSHSFMIRKKICSKVVQIRTTERKNGHTFDGVNKYRKDRFVEYNAQQKMQDKPQKQQMGLKQPDALVDSPSQNVQKYYQYKHQTTRTSTRPSKGVRCLKIRVNKQLKATLRISQHQSDISTPFIQQEASKVNKYVSQNNQNQRQIKKPEYVTQQTVSILPLDKKLNQILQNLPSKNNETSITRQNRVSSIKAIKYSYHQQKVTVDQSLNQSRASNNAQFVEEQREKSFFKKKLKQPTCLTHKIKWGNTSRKKLTSQKGLCQIYNQANFTKDQKQTFNKQNSKSSKFSYAKVTFLDEEPYLKKKRQNNIRQITIKKKESDKNIESNSKLQNNFAQTIQSRQFIDSLQFPYHSGSKSLIMFEDPGISVIVDKQTSVVNYQHKNKAKFTTLQQEYQQQSQNQQNNRIKMTKKPIYMEVNLVNRTNLEDGPLQSLQELYFQLKSHKSIKEGSDESLRASSLCLLCQNE